MRSSRWIALDPAAANAQFVDLHVCAPPDPEAADPVTVVIYGDAKLRDVIGASTHQSDVAVNIQRIVDVYRARREDGEASLKPVAASSWNLKKPRHTRTLQDRLHA
ncbi:MAG TPA: hypothetical protein VGM84_16285 [Steroidobacteraceae bacterium]|jgi:hypothetical protein